MIPLFLKAKHWQLFALMIGIPFFAQIIIMQHMASHVSQNAIPDPDVLVRAMGGIGLVVIFLLALFFGWLWSVGVGLQEKLPDRLKMNVRLFKAFVWFPVAYIILIVLLTSSMLSGLFTTVGTVGAGPFLLIIPLHFFAMFCIFYDLYFIAKTYKTAELQQAVKFVDFIGEFFLVWFYPVGIWILQPKINAMSDGFDENPQVLDLV